MRWERLNSLQRWWLDTTDPVFLNSPWLHRKSGRLFRCMWIFFQLGSWVNYIYIGKVNLEQFSQQGVLFFAASLIFILMCYLVVLISSLMTSRDTCGMGLLLCLTSLLSCACWEAWKATTTSSWAEFILFHSGILTGFLGNAFATLCHCNVHPLVLMPVVIFTFVYASYLFYSTGVHLLSLRFAHVVFLQVCLLIAFTWDFTRRINTVSTGMLHVGLSNTLDPFQSPVAGRSARSICWFAALGNFMFFTLILVDEGSQSYDKVLTMRWGLFSLMTWDGIAFGFCFFSLLIVRHPRCTSLQADCAFACLCYVPPAWALARQAFLCVEAALVVRDAMNMSFNLYMLEFYLSSLVFSTQAIVQAGCRPCVCLVAGVLLLVFVGISFQNPGCWECQELLKSGKLENPILALSLNLVTWPKT